MTEHKPGARGHRRIRGGAVQRIGKGHPAGELDLIRRHVYRILPTLPADLAELLWRVDLVGQPLQSAAKLAHIPLGEARQRLDQARVLLRDRLRAAAMIAAGRRVRRRERARCGRFKMRGSLLAGRASRLLRRMFQAPKAT